MPALEKRIFVLIVEKRQQIDPKARSLAFDPALSNVAREHSAAMAKADSFAGNGDPNMVTTLLMSQDAKFVGLVAENIAAQHFTPGQDIDVDAFARRFVDTWIASKAHRETLAIADLDRSGVGATANTHTIYVTQVFTSEFVPGEKTEAEISALKTPPGTKASDQPHSEPGPSATP